MPAIGVATDWTSGAGVFPAGGAGRSVANRRVAQVTIQYSGRDTSGNSITMSPIALNAASASGQGGGSEEREAEVFMPAQGVIVVTGTAGQKVTVLTA